MPALAKLADIRSGYSFRCGIQQDDSGAIAVLQIKDIKHADEKVGEMNVDSLPRMDWSFSSDPPLLQVGDIVLPARGEHYPAVMLRTDLPIVASSQLYVLQANRKRVLPEYLCWYLNQSSARNYILTNRAGTSIPMLSVSALSAMPVRLPTLAVQRRIADLDQLWRRERALTQKLLDNRRKTLDGVCHQLLES